MENPPAPLIRLEAVDDTRNIRRRYRIEWGQDLLGEWIVHTQWDASGGAVSRGRRRSRRKPMRCAVSAVICVGARRRAVGLELPIPMLLCRRRPQAPKPAPAWSTRLRGYRWIDGFDGRVEDEDDAILGVHTARGTLPDRLLLDDARQSRTTLAWGLYRDGEHVSGRDLGIGEWWANEVIRERVAQ